MLAIYVLYREGFIEEAVMHSIGVIQNKIFVRVCIENTEPE